MSFLLFVQVWDNYLSAKIYSKLSFYLGRCTTTIILQVLESTLVGLFSFMGAGKTYKTFIWLQKSLYGQFRNQIYHSCSLSTDKWWSAAKLSHRGTMIMTYTFQYHLHWGLKLSNQRVTLTWPLKMFSNKSNICQQALAWTTLSVKVKLKCHAWMALYLILNFSNVEVKSWSV